MKRVKKQLEAIERAQYILHEMNGSLELLAEHNKYQNLKIDEQGIAIKELRTEVVDMKLQPYDEAKENHNKIILAIMCTVVTLVVTLLFNRIFM